MHPFIDFFGINVPTYTVLFIAAIVAAWFLHRFLAKRSVLALQDVALTFVIGASGGLIGVVSLRPIMHAVRIAFSWQDYRHMSFLELADYATGELVFYGGLLGGILAIVLFCRKFEIDLVHIFDIFAPAVALAHAIGRAGCFFAGCCFGMRVEAGHPLEFMAVIYPDASLAAPSGVPLLPTQLMETGFLLVLCAVAVFLFLRAKRDAGDTSGLPHVPSKPDSKPETVSLTSEAEDTCDLPPESFFSAFKKRGLPSALYLFAYPIWRFFLEFFRADAARGRYGPFTTSQYISIGLVIFAIVYVYQVHKTFTDDKPENRRH
ncbi:MAG: prolipoprotein diacylglyceryl transferase [Defluviitaleaceae bacterium]|nr:prolipoprotein diacylglyceryl transferase [Defluviitaleaceae bacterium]